MNSGRYILYSILFFSLLTSCQPETSDTQKSLSYFDLKGLIEREVKILDSLKPAVIKKISLQGKVEKEQFPYDSSQLFKELKLFKEADINKPSLAGMYNLESSDGTTHYRWNGEGKKGIISMTVYRDKVSGQLKKLEAVYETENVIYHAREHLQMTFNPVKGNPIDTYSIKGFQKIAFKDTSRYSIEVKLRY